MEIRVLRSFLAVAETLHFTRAARRVHLSQSTLSHQIKELEREVGVPLFERGGRSVRLTEAGEVLREHAAQALQTLDAALPAIAEIGGLDRGQVTLGVVQVLDNLLLPRVVSRFREAHPGLGICIKRLWQGEIEAAVRSGDVDLGLCLDPPGLPGVALEVLAESPLAVVVAEGHPLAARPSLGLAELGRVPLIAFPRNGSWLRRLTDETLAAAGVEPSRPIEIDSIEGILATVRRGLGASFLPEAALGPARDGLRVIPLDPPGIRARVGLLWREGAGRSRAALALGHTIESVVRCEGLNPPQ